MLEECLQNISREVSGQWWATGGGERVFFNGILPITLDRERTKWNGCRRSVRLSLAYRAMYVIRNEQMEFVSVEEVSKHDY